MFPLRVFQRAVRVGVFPSFGMPRYLRLFSTAPVHPKPRLAQFQEVNTKKQLEMMNALTYAHTCRQIADLILENADEILPAQLSYAYYSIWNQDLDLDKHFFEGLIGVTKEFVKQMNREHNQSLAEIFTYCGWLGAKDPELWQLFEKKLVEERLYRYIPHKELGKMAHAAASAGQGSEKLFGLLEQQIIKHKLWLNEEDIYFAQEGFRLSGRGTPELTKALEHPRDTVPELASKGGKSAGHH